MNNFKLHTPTRILFGKGAIVDLRDQIPQDARVLITYGGGSVKKTGVLAQVQEALKGLDVREFGGIEPNPSYETLMKAVQLVRDENITFLLAVGGGSVLDGTKFIAAAAQYTDGVDPWHILETGGTEIRSAIPMGSVLTLPATGSESNAGAVISRKNHWRQTGLPLLVRATGVCRTGSGLHLYIAAAPGCERRRGCFRPYR
ncbi:alcohol dehydrogenase [Salmonella enterica subsp. enterica]|nr:alcohol dehydrogenase [Salmonella enterica subsp. enterica] [Salmonella enterica subsp. enterica serovar Menston]